MQTPLTRSALPGVIALFQWALALLVISQPLPAQSPESAAEPDQGLQEITVTAQFTPENLEEIPISMSVVSAETIAQNDMTTLTDVGSVVPNVTLQPGGTAGGKSVLAFIRGVGTGDFSYTVEPGVAVYFDDVFLSGQFGNAFDLLDVDRVEVLRGPQGTLFGKNSIGGAIRLIPKKPQGDGTGSAELILGDFSRREVRATVDLPVIGERLSLRLSAASRQREGYVERLNFACAHPALGGIVNPNAPYLPTSAGASRDCKVGTSGDENLQAARAALRWQRSDRLEINLAADWMNDHSGPGPQTLIAVDNSPAGALNNPFGGFNRRVAIPFYGIPYDSRFVPGSIYQSYDTYQTIVHVAPSATFPSAVVTGTTSIPPRNAVETYGLTASIESQLLPSAHLKSITAYRGYSGVFSQDVGGAPVSVAAQTNVLDHRQFSQELRFIGRLYRERLEWAAGVFYLDSYSLNRGPVTLSAYSWLQPDLDFTQDDPSNIRDRAAFIQTIWHLTGNLAVTLGARYTREHKDYTFRHESFNPAIPSLVPETATQVNYGRTNGKAAVEYRWSPELMTYVSVSNAFRAGGFNGRPFNASQVVAFGPEKLTAYEAGIKSEAFERRLRLNVAAFLSRYEDLQLPIFELDADGQPFSATINVGRAQITGGEIEIDWQPMAAMTMSGSFGLNKYENKDLGTAINCNAVSNPVSTPEPGANCSQNGPLPGSPLPQLPERTGRLGIQYRIRFRDGSTVTPHLDAIFQSRTFFDTIGSPQAADGGRTLLNGRLAWADRHSHWKVALTATNLTNRQYFFFKDDLRNIFGMVVGHPGPPRQWAVSVERDFE